MRATLAILSLPLLSLAACGGGGGGGTQSLGSIAPPISGGTVSGGGVVTSTPTPSPTSSPTSFLDVQTTTSFDAMTAMHSLEVDGSGASLYQGNASTAANSGSKVEFNPRDGIFTVSLSDDRAGLTASERYQDPAHRTDFAPVRRPYREVPDLPLFNYLNVLVDKTTGSTDVFFYKRPGNVGDFVSLAGFVQSTAIAPDGGFTSKRGVLVFGERTSFLQVPASGSGHFDGDMLATMVYSGSRDKGFPTSLPLQWISGTSSIDVDFTKSSVSLKLLGTVQPVFMQDIAVDPTRNFVEAGSLFTASGTATIAGVGAFSGKFLNAGFKTPGGVETAIDFAPISAASSTAGASSIDGAFYGPNAVNIGGNFRITGGVPDQRVDILGAFTGAKK